MEAFALKFFAPADTTSLLDNLITPLLQSAWSHLKYLGKPSVNVDPALFTLLLLAFRSCPTVPHTGSTVDTAFLGRTHTTDTRNKV